VNETETPDKPGQQEGNKLVNFFNSLRLDENDRAPRPVGRTEHGQQKTGSLKRFFSFESMISGFWIKILYFLGMILITAISFGMVSSGANQLIHTGGILLFIFGNILWRMFCEGTILFFRIHEELVAIKDKLPPHQ
jgi:hypothetical protein